MENHDLRVAELAKKVKDFYDKSIPFRLYHGNTNSTRRSVRTQANSLDVSHMNNVLKVDKVNSTCIVEPNVPMDKLVDATLEYGLVPLVVPEFPGITVGGSFAGTAGESSSFRHGFFDATVNWCEVILADGEVLRVSNEEKSDLFNGLKGTFGTIGVGVLFEVRCVKATEYVELSYHIIDRGITQAKDSVAHLCKQEDPQVDFVDGIMFSTQQGVVLGGRLTEAVDKGLPVAHFSSPSSPWFYLHVKDVMQRQLGRKLTKHDKQSLQQYQELVPIREYLFRYDRGAFWMGRHAFTYFITPFNRITRYVLDYFMHTRVMYHALHRSGIGQQFVIQDMAVPWDNVETFTEWIDNQLDVYPQWLCPLRADSAGGGLNPHGLNGRSDGLILNIGVWGQCPGSIPDTNRAIEKRLNELDGLKWLYATTYYTEREFWNVYDGQAYDALRVKYRAQSLPNVYDKVGGSGLNKPQALSGIWSIWPLAGLYGVLSTLKGGDYLRKR